MASFRTLLVLARASNLPTVWTNCLAGWILGGGEFAGENWFRFLQLGIGATLLYTGGMFLNDAFDTEFDRQHRRERPIPSGAISPRAVWIWGLSLLALGTALLVLLGQPTAVYALLLLTTILIYDAIHKLVAFSPLLMAACRFFLYLAAASATNTGVNGLVMWSGLALAGYVVGLSYLARKESVRVPFERWPALLLAAPIVLALVVNNRDYRVSGLVLSFIVSAWILMSLRHALGRVEPVIGRTVSALLAGIALVDWLAVGWVFVDGRPPNQWLGVFALLFVTARLFQRFIPAT